MVTFPTNPSNNYQISPVSVANPLVISSTFTLFSMVLTLVVHFTPSFFLFCGFYNTFPLHILLGTVLHIFLLIKSTHVTIL